MEYHQISQLHIEELYRTNNPQAHYEEEIDDISCYKFRCLRDIKERPRSEIIKPRARETIEQVDTTAEQAVIAAAPPINDSATERQRDTVHAAIMSLPRLRPSPGPQIHQRHHTILQLSHPKLRQCEIAPPPKTRPPASEKAPATANESARARENPPTAEEAKCANAEAGTGQRVPAQDAGDTTMAREEDDTAADQKRAITEAELLLEKELARESGDKDMATIKEANRVFAANFAELGLNDEPASHPKSTIPERSPDRKSQPLTERNERGGGADQRVLKESAAEGDEARANMELIAAKYIQQTYFHLGEKQNPDIATILRTRGPASNVNMTIVQPPALKPPPEIAKLKTYPWGVYGTSEGAHRASMPQRVC